MRQQKTLIAPLPKDLQPEEAVTLIEPLIAAQYVLIEVARLGRDQTVLLDNAASAVGQGLVQAAKTSGTKIFALVYSKVERDLLVDRFGIPADHIFDSLLGNSATRIQDATKRFVVDVIVSQQ